MDTNFFFLIFLKKGTTTTRQRGASATLTTGATRRGRSARPDWLWPPAFLLPSGFGSSEDFVLRQVNQKHSVRMNILCNAMILTFIFYTDH
jgi:hypothetical protein